MDSRPITLSEEPAPHLSHVSPFLPQDVSPLDTPTTTMAQPQTPNVTRGTGTGEPPTLTPFELLPLEIILLILSHLDYRSVLYLSCSNTSLRASLNPDVLFPRSFKADFLQVAETFPRYRYSLACFRCLRLLPRLSFANTHRAGPKGKHSSHPAKQRQRFCHECGIAGGLYPHMRGFWLDKTRIRLCHRCGNCTTSRECPCTHPLPPRPTFSPLERLPPALLHEILTHLPHHSIIALHATSRRLRTAIPSPHFVAPIHERYQDLILASKREGAPTPLIPCFGCFRLRPPANFTTRQLVDEPEWRWRCMRCLQLFYGCGRDTDAGKEGRERFDAQDYCKSCCALRVAGHDGDGQCEGCEEHWRRVEASLRKMEASLRKMGSGRVRPLGEQEAAVVKSLGVLVLGVPMELWIRVLGVPVGVPIAVVMRTLERMGRMREMRRSASDRQTLATAAFRQAAT